MSNSTHTSLSQRSGTPSVPADMVTIEVRYSCHHSFSSLVSSKDASNDRASLPHPCMACSYRRAEEAAGEIFEKYEGEIGKRELWMGGLRGKGTVQSYLMVARMKHMEEVALLKWKRDVEVRKAWEIFDARWGKSPLGRPRRREREDDDEMEID
ncbi:MAG: hypothetical protein Q9163_001046 [Psora crenata]